MNKPEFLTELRNALSGLPQEDIEERIAFYGEIIDDRMEEGLGEEYAVAAAGPLEEIRAQIVSETPLQKLVKEKVKPERRLRAWEKALIVLGFPVWLPLIAAFFALIISLYVCVFAVIVSLWAVEAALCLCALAGAAAAVIFFIRGFTIQAAAALGAGIFLAGFSLLFFAVCKWVTAGLLYLTKRIVFTIKSKLVNRGETQ